MHISVCPRARECVYGHNVCVDVLCSWARRVRVSLCVCVFMWGTCSVHAVCTQVCPCVSGDMEEGQPDPREFGGIFPRPGLLAPRLSQVRDSREPSRGAVATLRLFTSFVQGPAGAHAALW